MKVFEDLGYIEPNNVVKVILSIAQDDGFSPFKIMTTIDKILCWIEVEKHEDGQLHAEIKEIAREAV